MSDGASHDKSIEKLDQCRLRIVTKINIMQTTLESYTQNCTILERGKIILRLYLNGWWIFHLAECGTIQKERWLSLYQLPQSQPLKFNIYNYQNTNEDQSRR